MAVAGSDEAREASCVGSTRPVDQLLEELEKADDWGLLRFVPHERLDPGPRSRPTAGCPTSSRSTRPDAWHPLDLLVAPLYDDDGVLRGTLVDGPAASTAAARARPSAPYSTVRRAGRAAPSSSRWSAQALADQVRMAEAARRIVRGATAQLSLERIVADSQEALVEGFRAAGMWLQTFDSEDEGPGSGAIYSADGAEVELTPQLVEIAERAARRAWEIQEVGGGRARTSRSARRSPTSRAS